MCPAPGHADPFGLLTTTSATPGHVGELVEFLAGAGTLRRSRSAGRADPVGFFLVLACGRRSGNHAHHHPAGHVGERVECERVEFLAGAGTLADPVPLHAAQPLQLLDVPASTASCCPASAGTLQRSRSAGLPDPVAFFLVLACRARSATTPTPSRATSTASCHPASAGHQHPAGHVGERVEILAGIPLQGDCIPASTGHQHHLVPPSRPHRHPGRDPGQRRHAAAQSIGWPG